ncbi:hypothetical protein T484DRAFT_1779562 [Baffinella frigidus]|nr:hypothetical protein T484DRAFT_1779562 [Cryptophyta sp. CCMP2293]
MPYSGPATYEDMQPCGMPYSGPATYEDMGMPYSGPATYEDMVPFFEQFATPFRQQDPNAKKTQFATPFRQQDPNAKKTQDMVPFFEQFATPFRQQDPNAKKTQDPNVKKTQAGGSTAAPTGPVPQVSRAEGAGFDDLCGNKGGLCAIAFLDGSNKEKLEEQLKEKLEEHLKVLEGTRAKKHPSPYSFAWVDAACYRLRALPYNRQL